MSSLPQALNTDFFLLQVIFAAKSRSMYNVDLENVEEQGVFNTAKAIMVCSSSFNNASIALYQHKLLWLHAPLSICYFASSRAYCCRIIQ